MGLIKGWWWDHGNELWTRLGKSCDPYFLLQLWLIVINSWCCIGVCLVLRLIGWYDVELKCLDYDLWGVVLSCKFYKDGEWFTNVPY